MNKRRTRLEPVGRFAVLVALAHVALGLGVWWWLSSRQKDEQDSVPKNLVWVSPSDFPAPDPTAAPKTEPPKAEPPKPVDEPKPMVAAGTPPPAPTKPLADDDDHVPKAIAIDPARAAELMAKANATPAPEVPPAAAPSTPSAPVPPTPAPPSTPTVAAKDSPPPSGPTMEPKPEVKAEAKAEVKPAPKADEPPPPPPALPGTDAARYITISHPAPAPASPPPPGTTLSELAAQNAGTGVHIDSIDRAIIDAFLRVWTPPPANKLPTDQRTAHVEVTVNREGKLVKYKPTRNSGNIELDMSVLEAANRLNKIDATLPADYPHEFYEFQVNFHVE